MNVQGLHVAVDDIGEGPVVLLLHGWGAMRQAWGRLPQEIEKMGFRVVSLDFPGHGESDDPPVAWSVDDYAQFTKALIDQLQADVLYVICHSFGGRITIRLASQWPTLFAKIVMVDVAGIRPKRTWRYYIRTYRYKLAKRMAKIGFINRLFSLDEKMKNVGSADYQALKTDTMRQTFIKVVNQDLRPLLPKIQAPTLLVWGSEDQDTPLYMGKTMEKEIPNAGLVVFEGAGHYSYLDEFVQFVTIIRHFFLYSEKK